MFGHRYFATRYYAPRYFGDGGNLVPPTEDTGARGGFYPFMLHDAGPKRRKKGRSIRRELEAAFAAFNEAPAAVVEEVREIVAPAIVAGPAPNRVVVDVAALEASAERVRRLLELYAAEEARRRFDEEDEADVEFMLRYG